MPSRPPVDREGEKRQSARIRVLAVDDDATLLETVVAVLEDDFSVTCCTSGAEALDLLTRASFDVVCTDYKMPGMDGMELLSRIAALQLNLGAVLTTGKAEAYFREQMQFDLSRTLPLSVVLKPYNVEELIDAIKRADTFARMRRAVDAATLAVGRFKGPAR